MTAVPANAPENGRGMTKASSAVAGRSRGNAPARARRAFWAHLVNESRLLLREPPALIFGAILPLIAITVMSAIPPARQPIAEFGGLSVVQTYAPTIMLFATSILGLTVIPMILGSYREMGVLRRLRTTPSSPGSLLAALFTIVTVVGLVVALLIVVIPALFGAGLPQGIGLFALAAVLSLLAFVALGVLLASVVRNPKAAAGIGNVFAALMWFFAGMWYPRALFPQWLAAVADLTPGGAAATAMSQATLGLEVGWQPFVVLLVWTAAAGWLATRTFRWE
ncbi:MAG TPA: ABC transporter permease [Actinomycetales bacterium]|nr:ABC transporter permease [Actinomycetales bacterium]